MKEKLNYEMLIVKKFQRRFTVPVFGHIFGHIASFSK